jgi:hypothetical protein
MVEENKREEMNKKTVVAVLRLVTCGAIVGVAVAGVFGGSSGSAEVIGATVGGSATLLLKLVHLI